ncbi:hypothetical protein [Kocuria sp. CPCC 205261]|uniref:hypothetical protein n=1 Tax=Kocuria sp. CPCC 205261 TaxID=3073554 RepID=UPI0034D63A78
MLVPPHAQMWLANTLAHAPGAAIRRYWAGVVICEWVHVCRWKVSKARRNSSGVTLQIPLGWSP